MATISDYKLMLEEMKSVKSVELPFVKGMKDLDFSTYENLQKVTGNSLSDQRNILTINPKYDGTLFDELCDQYVLFYIKLFCSRFKAFILLTSRNNQISESPIFTTKFLF